GRNNNHRRKMNTDVGTCSSTESDRTLNDANPLKEGTGLMLLFRWSRFEILMKEDVGNVLDWVKLHDVPVTAFSEDGLSAIAMKLDTSLMLDSYTSDMCLQSWGRSSYAKVMIELWVDVELKDNIVVDFLKIIREGHYI
nr:hypothetical protein [Tanacetum cinerariifolium]